MKLTHILGGCVLVGMIASGCTPAQNTETPAIPAPSPTPYSSVPDEVAMNFAELEYTHAGFLKNDAGKTMGTVMVTRKDAEYYLQAVIESLPEEIDEPIVGELTGDALEPIMLEQTELDEYGNRVILYSSSEPLTEYTSLVISPQTNETATKPLLKATISAI